MTTANDVINTDIVKAHSLRSLNRVRLGESVIYAILIGCTAFSILVTVAIVVLLLSQTVHFFGFPDVSLAEFVAGTQWSPLLGAKKHFGVLPLVTGTMLIAAVAMAVAVPLGLMSAVFLSEYAPRKVRSVIKPILEVLAGIPTVVYGFFALIVITPFLRDALGLEVDYYNALSAGIAVGILCLPTVCSLAEDALQAVPQSLREAAYGLGGTRFDVAVRVVVPAALSGIVSATLLAISRAVGETMIVALAAGSVASMTVNPLRQVQTITAYITQVAKGDVENFGVEYYSIYAVATTLFLMTLTLTVVGHIVRKRYQEAYD